MFKSIWCTVYLCSKYSWSWWKVMSYCRQFRHVSAVSCRHWIHLAGTVSSPVSSHWSLACLVSGLSWTQHWPWMSDVICCGVSMMLNAVHSLAGLYLSLMSCTPNHRNGPAWKIRKLHLTFNRLELRLNLWLVILPLLCLFYSVILFLSVFLWSSAVSSKFITNYLGSWFHAVLSNAKSHNT